MRHDSVLMRSGHSEATRLSEAVSEAHLVRGCRDGYASQDSKILCMEYSISIGDLVANDCQRSRACRSCKHARVEDACAAEVPRVALEAREVAA